MERNCKSLNASFLDQIDCTLGLADEAKLLFVPSQNPVVSFSASC